jgi:hypothetical protein
MDIPKVRTSFRICFSVPLYLIYILILPSTQQITHEGRIMTLKNLNHSNVRQWSCRHSRAEECPFQVRCPVVNNKVILTKLWTKWRQDDANASGFKVSLCAEITLFKSSPYMSSSSSFVLFGIIQLGTYEIEKLITSHVSWGQKYWWA